MFDTKLERLVTEFESEATFCQDIDSLNKLAQKFGKVAHPQVGYRLGEKFLIHDSKENSIGYLVNSISFGLEPLSPYLSTGYADSIGQSMFHLINNFDFQREFEPYKYNLFCSAYFCLSRCIDGMGIHAFNSLRTRALMIDNYEDEVVERMLRKYYYNGDDLCKEILSISDYYFASEGFRSVREVQNSATCLKWAEQNLAFIQILPQYALMNRLDIAQVAHISQQNQDHLVKNLVTDFQKGTFQMSSNDFSNAVSNYRMQ
jgi:hypothetical protein